MDFNYLVNSSAFFKMTQWCGTYMINFILWNYHICPGTLHPTLGSVLLWVLELVLFPGSLPEGWWWQCQQDGLWACQGCPTLLQLLPLKLPCQPGGTGCPSPKHCAPWVQPREVEGGRFSPGPSVCPLSLHCGLSYPTLTALPPPLSFYSSPSWPTSAQVPPISWGQVPIVCCKPSWLSPTW